MPQYMKISLIAPISLALTVLAGPAFATTILVNSNGDAVANDGACTLREAIIAANSNVASGNLPGECAAGQAAPGVDVIAFVVPAGVLKISPVFALPAITEAVLVDGYAPSSGGKANTLPVGDNAIIKVELDATGITPALALDGAASSNSTIRGLAITHADDIGILVSNGSNNDTVSGNFIGVDVAGSTSSGTGTAVYVLAANDTTVGGTLPADRNVIGAEGVYLSGANSNNVQGNYVGVDKTGTIALTPAPSVGIASDSGSYNLVGGAAAGAGNVVGAWSNSGIQLAGNGIDNFVQGNLIGTNAAATARLSNGAEGIVYTGSGSGNRIGGSAPGEGNTVAASAIAGIFINGTSTDLVVQGNSVGTDETGMLSLANASGIAAFGGSGVIGGTAFGAGNRIAFNNSIGVGVFSSAQGWAILGNDIHGNGSLGISLGGGNAATPNDFDDLDVGPNYKQNYPVVSSVTIGPATTAHISGSLNSTTGVVFRLEFFANASCGAAGTGQGKKFIGFANVQTNPNDVSFGPLAFSVPADRHVISATATDSSGNTSEFSPCSGQDTIFSDGLEGD